VTPAARRRGLVLCALALATAGCSGDQSVLAPRGPEAERVALLSWILFSGGAAIMLAVLAAIGIALFGPPHWRGRLARESAVTALGLAFPVVVLSALLAYGLTVTRGGGAAAGGAPLHIEVVGEMWWWRVIYRGQDGARFETANEIRIPVGRPVALTLTTADVIHSFWVPNLAGKLDMIPGRANVLTLAAREPGVSRGQCAEYCGGAHALMAFHVEAMEPGAFAQWLAAEAAPARPPPDAQARQGERLFAESGCGGCHAVRGTAAAGRVGPDLTHLGGRRALAAGIMPNDAAAIARWIRDNQHIKPGNRMPPYRIFSADELAALAHYLAGLG